MGLCRQVNVSSQAAAVSRGKMVPTEKLAQTCEPVPAGLVIAHPGNSHVLLAPSPLKDVERNNKGWMVPFLTNSLSLLSFSTSVAWMCRGPAVVWRLWQP